MSTTCLVRRAFDGDSCMVYVACPLRPTRLRLALFATTVLQRPAPRFRPSSLRSPRNRPRPPFGASKLHSLKRLQSHELKPVDEYCTTLTTPFCNGAFRGEILTSHVRPSVASTILRRVAHSFLFWISHLLS